MTRRDSCERDETTYVATSFDRWASPSLLLILPPSRYQSILILKEKVARTQTHFLLCVCVSRKSLLLFSVAQLLSCAQLDRQHCVCVCVLCLRVTSKLFSLSDVPKWYSSSRERERERGATATALVIKQSCGIFTADSVFTLLLSAV
jgi:hypothetical protein